MAAVAMSKVHHDPGINSNSPTVTIENDNDSVLENDQEKQKQKADLTQVPVSQVHTPPTTDEASHKDDDAASTSSLSDIDGDLVDEENRMRFEDAARAGAEAEQYSEVKPDHFENGVPIFKPTMEQFRDFERYVKGVDPYGMQSGIVLIDPPEEWKQARKALDDMIKTIKIKNPITQEFHGAQGIYTQRNMEKMRSYNLPQWKSLCEQTENQPPARRGEKRLNADKLLGRGSFKPKKSEPLSISDGAKRKPGRPRTKPIKQEMIESESPILAPPTPTSPDTRSTESVDRDEVTEENQLDDATPTKAKRGRKPGFKVKGNQPKSSVKKEGNKGSETTVAARRLRIAGENTDVVDEEAFKDFDYRVYDNDQWTAERCDELEEKYWKSLNFSNPMYAADMPGSLFDERTKEWNVAKLPNLLDLLGQPIPGVNTAYLYLGMWRATFAWHLEDVDLYSINYIHFGAPKQWYSISQKDAPKFEAAMKAVWSSDAKNCDQFLRHKTYLVSPSLLKSKYGVTVNKVVHREGQFVITFPIGYHSGYNLGYNCAESVNFAIENWLQYGKTARKCQCEADSVFIDVDWFVRKMNGEPTPEYEEIEVTDDEDDDLDEPTDLPTPPGSDRGKIKLSQKRKRSTKDVGPNKKAKKIIKIRKVSKNQPCCLCPNDFSWEQLLPTTHGQKAHRTCAMYTPETYIATDGGKEMVFNVENISKARLELKCYECRQKKGSCFQCSSAKCTKSYHATCAIQAGVQVDKGEISVWHEGVEYRDVGFDWRCRLHRTVKRTRITSEASACNHANSCWSNVEFLDFLQNLKPGELIQWQPTYADDIEAGVVISEFDEGLNAVLVRVLPEQKQIKEIEASWILFVDSKTSCLQKPSANALDLPEELQGKTASLPDSSDRKPSEGDPFTEDPKTEWAEFVSAVPPHNSAQKAVNLSKDKQLWLYLGKNSTDSKAQFTSNPESSLHDPASNFLDTVDPPKSIMAPPSQPKRQSLSATYPMIPPSARNAAMSTMGQQAIMLFGHPPHSPNQSIGPAHEAVMNVTREKMLEMQKAGQIQKPSQYRDLLAGAEARANEQARILQRQHAKAQQNDIQDRLWANAYQGIGVDRQSIERQRQFQQNASNESKDFHSWQSSGFTTMNAQGQVSGASSQPNDGLSQPIQRNQPVQYSSDWMNPTNFDSRSTLYNHQNYLTTSNQSVMPQTGHQSPPMTGANSISPSFNQHSHPNFPPKRSPQLHSPQPNLENGFQMGGISAMQTFPSNPHPPILPNITTHIEHQRRISNPAYPFKSPDQIQAQKDAEKGMSPGSRPESGHILSSPQIRQHSFQQGHPVTNPSRPIDPQNPPQFINPNATQISPPGSSNGIISQHNSMSGLSNQMGPPARTISKGNVSNDSRMTNTMFSASPMVTNDYLSRRPMFDPIADTQAQYGQHSFPPPQPSSSSPFHDRSPPMADPSKPLLAALEPRPTSSDGLTKNDRPVPKMLTEWQEKGGFWGKVADYFVMRHEVAATVHRSPFTSPVIEPTGSSTLSSQRYYQSLSEENKNKIDIFVKEINPEDFVEPDKAG